MSRETEIQKELRELAEAQKKLLDAFMETLPGKMIIWLLNKLGKVLRH